MVVDVTLAQLFLNLSLSLFFCLYLPLSHETVLSNLEINFQPHVNFVFGPNGSGKSAILSGIIIGESDKLKSHPLQSRFPSTPHSPSHSSALLPSLRLRRPC